MNAGIGACSESARSTTVASDPSQPGDAGSEAVEGGGPMTPFHCEPNAAACDGAVLGVCRPDGSAITPQQTCADVCVPALGCVTCVPGSRKCEGALSLACSADGLRYGHGRDCAEWQSVCGADGFCDDACGRAEAARSNVGCEYWPTPLANTTELSPDVFDFRVVVANPDAKATATVRVLRGAAEVAMQTVAAGGVVEIKLPWIDGQSFQGSGAQGIVMPDGAYRLLSDLPVTVTQFNPFEYAVSSTLSFTNDSSLLLPQHVLTGDYVGVSYVPFSRTLVSPDILPGTGIGPGDDASSFPGYLALIGTTPTPANIQILLSGNIAADRGGRWPATSKGGTIAFSLMRGEVAHVMAQAPPACDATRPGYARLEATKTPFGESAADTCEEREYDLTGSRVQADQPLVVFGGHLCAYVPTTAQACDHLESQLAPIQTWGKAFAGMPMSSPEQPRPNIVRVVAAFDGTVVHVKPESLVAAATLPAGRWLEFTADQPFSIEATKAVQVTQYLVGQYYGGGDSGRGDPAMTPLVPREQFRKDYTFIAPSSYSTETNGQSYVLISREPGSAVSLDGVPVSASFRAIGDRELTIVPVQGGSHSMQGASPFGIILFGLGSFTSYADPGGLNLEQITTVEVI